MVSKIEKKSIIYQRKFQITDQNIIQFPTDCNSNGANNEDKWAFKFELPQNFDQNFCTIQISNDFWADLISEIRPT